MPYKPNNNLGWGTGETTRYGSARGNTLVKLVVTVVIVGLLGWGGYLGVKKIIKGLEPPSPYPTDPCETTTDFFKAMYNRNYYRCYQLLTPVRKAATLIKQQSRDNGYYRHFERVRTYLVQRSGEDFINSMKVSPNGGKVTFANDIVLRVKLEGKRGSYSKKMHYAVSELVDFPIDVAPKMGVERYYRGLDQMMSSPDGTTGEVDDVSAVIRDVPGESKLARQRRLIDAFNRARQLDTRHSLLEWILRERSRQNMIITNRFLNKLARDDKQPPQLRRLAEEYLR